VSYQQLVSGLREVVYEATFDTSLKEFSDDFFRADEFIRGAEWVLTRDPYSGNQIHAESIVWCLPVAAVDEFPAAMLYYTFNDRYVWMLDIHVDSGEFSDESSEED
jgi:hypothetical protein